MKPKKTKRTILKLSNPTGAVIVDNRRFEANTLGQGERFDSMAYSCDDWAMRDKKELEDKHPNIRIEIVRGEY